MGYDGSLKFDTAINAAGFNAGIKNLGNIAKGGLSVLGGAIAGVTAAMGAGVTAAVNVGMSFESQMSKVQAISGATGGELEQLAEKANPGRLLSIWQWPDGKRRICWAALRES